MRYFKTAFVLAGVIWLAGLAGAAFWLFAPSDNILGLQTSASAYQNGFLPGSIGTHRYQTLVEATRLYNKDRKTAQSGAIDGTDFAPVPFLNRELERQGAKWRVRSTDGLEAKIYEIS